MKARLGFFGAALLLICSTGCSEHMEGVVVSQLTTPPLDAHASDGRIELYEGTAVGIQLQAFTERPDNPHYKCCGSNCIQQCRQFDNALDTADVSVGGDGAVTVLSAEDAGVYIVVAQHVGQGRVIVTADGVDGEYDLPVTVRAQPTGGSNP